jgi:hypothetical protein
VVSLPSTSTASHQPSSSDPIRYSRLSPQACSIGLNEAATEPVSFVTTSDQRPSVSAVHVNATAPLSPSAGSVGVRVSCQNSSPSPPARRYAWQPETADKEPALRGHLMSRRSLCSPIDPWLRSSCRCRPPSSRGRPTPWRHRAEARRGPSRCHEPGGGSRCGGEVVMDHKPGQR